MKTPFPPFPSCKDSGTHGDNGYELAEIPNEDLGSWNSDDEDPKDSPPLNTTENGAQELNANNN